VSTTENLPIHMRGAVITEQGLAIAELPVPTPAPDQILVKVHYAALNRADLAMSAGHKHGAAGGLSAVAGLEFSGVVAAVGQQVADFKVGDNVMCSGAGAYAQYALTDSSRCNLLPTSAAGKNVYSLAEAATLPVALQTMHDAIVTNGRLAAGESVLIQGASSGVGILGMQIAKQMGAGLVIGSATHAERRQALLSYGADLVIDSRNPGWVQEVRDATEGKGVDLLVDQISGYVANDNMRATRVLGRIVNVGRLGGMHGDFNFDLHALRRIQYIGVTFRTRSTTEVQDINNAMRRDLWPALQSKAMHIPIDNTFRLEEVVAAQTYMRENQHFGKILLEI
jgi:NADPH:quinone reductase-like Zn-dependent oxidoreductase